MRRSPPLRAWRDACGERRTTLVDWAAWPETHSGDCCPAEEATETAPADFLECCAAAELPRFSFYDETARPNTTAAVPSYADDHGGSVAVLRGAGFRPSGSSLQCVVGAAPHEVIHVPAFFISTTRVRCEPPQSPSGGAHCPRLRH